jgi:hypothetical protein
MAIRTQRRCWCRWRGSKIAIADTAQAFGAGPPGNATVQNQQPGFEHLQRTSTWHVRTSDCWQYGVGKQYVRQRELTGRRIANDIENKNVVGELSQAIDAKMKSDRN